MRMSGLLGERQKENPADAVLASHRFLVRGGYVRQVANGIWSLLTPGRRVAAKIEAILRDEMEAAGGQEVLMPVALPADLWQESGRWDTVGTELMRMKDRTGHDMLLAMTHEEAAVHLARHEAASHAKYPFLIYQLQTKFRDEPRSRGGLIRVREFTMKDAYSFHTSQEDLERQYWELAAAYHRIFARVGLPQVVSVSADTGIMGGKVAHEFMLPAAAGEDSLLLCAACGYRANLEVAHATHTHADLPEESLRTVHTPGITDIASLAEFFNTPESRLLKAAVFQAENREKPVIVFLRGDRQVNEAKLRRLAGAQVAPWPGDQHSGLCLGFTGPLGLDSEWFDMLFDESLRGESNLICGANVADLHMTGVSMPRDLGDVPFVDAATAREGDACPQCGTPLSLTRGIEVGNIFQLGDAYTRRMDMTYTDADGNRRYPVMGCYGIGVGRLVACLIEAHHDDFGPVWPVAVAPWQVHLCLLNADTPACRDVATALHEQLSPKYDVLFDDRGCTAGVQFADADLLGVPVRLIVSKRNLERGEVELSSRDKRIRRAIPLDAILPAVTEALETLANLPE